MGNQSPSGIDVKIVMSSSPMTRCRYDCVVIQSVHCRK